MPDPALSPDEQERLAALRRYDILDTPPEERFDRVSRLAARWFEVPISLITFLDEDRQWFKSHLGFDRNEVPRTVAFGTHNVRDPSVMVVEDATQDPRFSTNPLVTDPPEIRFYAEAPLLADEHYLGALCVIDTVPRAFASEEIGTLRDLAAIVLRELELRTTNQLLRERTQQVQSLSRALTKAERTERRRFRRLLHDDLQQVLHAARMRVELLQQKGPLSDEQRERAVEVADKIGEATEITRTLSARFTPPFREKSLCDALDWLARTMEETYDLAVSVQSRGPALVTDFTLKTLLFRLTRELLFNVVKHAGTDEARVVLRADEEHLKLIIEDEGAGFDPDEEGTGGLGLPSLRERIEIMGGTVRFDAAPGAGTRVIVRVPWTERPLQNDGPDVA